VSRTNSPRNLYPKAERIHVNKNANGNLGSKKAEMMNRLLEQRIQELEEERIPQGRTNIDDLSQHGSNSRCYAVMKSN